MTDPMTFYVYTLVDKGRSVLDLESAQGDFLNGFFTHKKIRVRLKFPQRSKVMVNFHVESRGFRVARNE